jgi:hypothetical protein
MTAVVIATFIRKSFLRRKNIDLTIIKILHQMEDHNSDASTALV